jgi:undecaprenyl-diphosphatase
MLLTISVVGGLLLSNLLKWSYARPRPDLVPAIVQVYSASFPSGHATMSAVTYLALGVLLAEVHPARRFKLYFISLALVITVAVGLSRIYLGVHYPTDVLAGWCIGAAWALLCRILLLWLRQRRRARG